MLCITVLLLKILMDKLKDMNLSKGILKFDFKGTNCMKSVKNKSRMEIDNQNNLYCLKDTWLKDKFQNKFRLERKGIYLTKLEHTSYKNLNWKLHMFNIKSCIEHT